MKLFLISLPPPKSGTIKGKVIQGPLGHSIAGEAQRNTTLVDNSIEDKGTRGKITTGLHPVYHHL